MKRSLYIIGLMVSLVHIASAQADLKALLARRDSIQDEQEEIAINTAIIGVYQDQGIDEDTLLVRTLTRQAYLSWRSDPYLLDSLSGLAKTIAMRIDDAYGIADALFMQGFYQDLSGNFDEALTLYFEALERMKALGRKDRLGPIQEYIGIVYRFTGEYEQSLKYYLMALANYETFQDSVRIGNAYNSLGNLYFDQRIYDEARTYYEKALVIKRKYSSPNSIANTLGNLATIYSYNDELTKALEIAQEVLAIKLATKSLQDIPVAYSNLGRIYERLRQLDKAEEMMIASIKADLESQNPQGLSGDYRFYANIKRQKGEYQTSYRLLDSAERYARELRLPNDLFSVYEERVMLDTTVKNFKSAFYNLYEMMRVNDTLSNEELARKQARLEADYEYNKERDSVAFVNRQEKTMLETKISYQQKTNTFFIIGILLVSVLAFIIYWQYRRQKLSNLQLAQLNQAIQQQNVEINQQKKQLEQAIKARNQLYTMIAHDLRAPVSIFYGAGFVVEAMLEDNDQDGLRKYAHELARKASRLSQLLDNLLRWARDHNHQMAYQPEELEVFPMIDSLLELYQYLADTKEIALINEVNKSDKLWADPNSFEGIIRNLVNNAIKFTPTGGKIILKSEVSDSKYMLSISDTGVGMTQEQIDLLLGGATGNTTAGTVGEQGTGLGLTLVQDFIRQHGGTLEIASEIDKGTTFMVSFPTIKG